MLAFPSESADEDEDVRAFGTFGRCEPIRAACCQSRPRDRCHSRAPAGARSATLQADRRNSCPRHGVFRNREPHQNIRDKRDLIPRQCVHQLSASDIEFACLYGTNPIATNQMRETIVSGSIAEH
jgi:hypothetical protein